MATVQVLPQGTTATTSLPFDVLQDTHITLTMTGGIYNTTSPVQIFIEKENSDAVFEPVLIMSNTLASIILVGEGTYRARRAASPIPCGLDAG